MDNTAPPVDIDALADRIAETAALLDVVTHRLLTDLRRFDDQAGWARQGALSCAHWLSWRCRRHAARCGAEARTLPAALRRAVIARDRGCRFPGCTNRRTLLLCGRHHTLVHEGGFRAVVHCDRLRFFDPAGTELPNAGPPVPIASLPSVACTPAPGWDGDPVDYDAAVACLT